MSPNKLGWGAALCTTLLVFAAVVWVLKVPADKSPQFPQSVPLPFPHSVLLAGVQPGPMNSAPLWHSDHEVVAFQDLHAFLVDAHTGVQTPLTALDKRIAGGMTFSEHMLMSPDGKWLLWQDSDATTKASIWQAATLDGLRQRVWPRDDRYQYPKIAWMRDSRHWREVGSYEEGGANLDALLFSVDRPGVKKTAITLPSLCSPTGLWDTPANHVIVASMIDGAGSDDLFDFGSTPGTAPPVRTTYNVPGHVRQCVPSPDGRRLAWLLYTVHDAPRRDVPERVVTFLTQTQSLYTVNVWVSNADGSRLHPISPERDITAGHSASGIQWTPDGKDVTYLADHSVWALPTD